MRAVLQPHYRRETLDQRAVDRAQRLQGTQVMPRISLARSRGPSDAALNPAVLVKPHLGSRRMSHSGGEKGRHVGNERVEVAERKCATASSISCSLRRMISARTTTAGLQTLAQVLVLDAVQVCGVQVP